jgi:hypothetical protein
MIADRERRILFIQRWFCMGIECRWGEYENSYKPGGSICPIMVRKKRPESQGDPGERIYTPLSDIKELCFRERLRKILSFIRRVQDGSG